MHFYWLETLERKLRFDRPELVARLTPWGSAHLIASGSRGQMAGDESHSSRLNRRKSRSCLAGPS